MVGSGECVLCLLFRGDIPKAESLLGDTEAAAASLQSTQDTGHQAQLCAEVYRRTNRPAEAFEAAQRAVLWLGQCPNQSLAREALLEGVACAVAVGDTSKCHEWLSWIDPDTPASRPFRVAADALLTGGPAALRVAATGFADADFVYRGLQFRLDAARLENVVDLDLAAEARECGAHWIVDAVESIGASDAPPTRGLPISPRESQVLELMAQGLSNKRIADCLFISDRTVSTHVSNLLKKIGARNRAEAVAVWTGAR